MSSLIHNPVTQYKLYIYVDDVDLKKKYEEQIENRIENNTTDSGFDLFTANEEVYKPGQLKMINHKVKCKMVVQSNFGPEIPTGFLLHPRSSTFKKYQLLMSNNTGIIDQDYRGDIIAAMYCPITESDFKFYHMSMIANNIGRANIENKIDIYTRIAQICAPNYRPFKVEIVNELDNTQRGSGGFGSTGN